MPRTFAPAPVSRHPAGLAAPKSGFGAQRPLPAPAGPLLARSECGHGPHAHLWPPVRPSDTPAFAGGALPAKPLGERRRGVSSVDRARAAKPFCYDLGDGRAKRSRPSGVGQRRPTRSLLRWGGLGPPAQLPPPSIARRARWGTRPSLNPPPLHSQALDLSPPTRGRWSSRRPSRGAPVPPCALSRRSSRSGKSRRARARCAHRVGRSSSPHRLRPRGRSRRQTRAQRLSHTHSGGHFPCQHGARQLAWSKQAPPALPLGLGSLKLPTFPMVLAGPHNGSMLTCLYSSASFEPTRSRRRP